MIGIGIATLLVGTLLFAIIAIPRLARQRIHANVFTGPPLGSTRPSDVGIDYEQLMIPVGNHHVHAWFIPVSQPVASVLLFHGQNDALSSLVTAIARLHQQHFTVMVFNYSGHGESTGKPTIEGVRADCIAAYSIFCKKVTSEARYLLGYSLGAAVLLDAFCHYPMEVRGIILASPFSSIRDVIQADGMPRWLLWVIPNVYNNVHALAAARCPVLIVHSETDGTFPLSMAHQLHAANPAAEFRVVATPKHSEVLASFDVIGDHADAYWEAIFHFIQKHL